MKSPLSIHIHIGPALGEILEAALAHLEKKLMTQIGDELKDLAAQLNSTLDAALVRVANEVSDLDAQIADLKDQLANSAGLSQAEVTALRTSLSDAEKKAAGLNFTKPDTVPPPTP